MQIGPTYYKIHSIHPYSPWKAAQLSSTQQYTVDCTGRQAKHVQNLKLGRRHSRSRARTYVRIYVHAVSFLLTQHSSKTSCSWALPQGLGFEIAPAYSALYMS